MAPVVPLQRVVDNARREHWEAGELWYQTANGYAYALADEFGLVIDQAAGVIAALSPRCSWTRNVDIAREVIATGWTRLTMAENVSKALRILEGSSPDDILGGFKVRSFYANIMSAGLDRNVTVDTHAWSAIYGTPLGAGPSRWQDYSMAVEMYQDLADRRDVPPPMLQATVWCAWLDGIR